MICLGLPFGRNILRRPILELERCVPALSVAVVCCLLLFSSSAWGLSSKPYSPSQEQVMQDLEDVVSTLLDLQLSAEEEDLFLEILENQELSAVEQLAALTEQFSALSAEADVFTAENLQDRYRRDRHAVAVHPVCIGLAAGLATGVGNAVTTWVLEKKGDDDKVVYPQDTKSITLNREEKLVKIIHEDGSMSAWNYRGNICGSDLSDVHTYKQELRDATRAEREGANMTPIEGTSHKPELNLTGYEKPSADLTHGAGVTDSPAEKPWSDGTLLEDTWIGDAIDWLVP